MSLLRTTRGGKAVEFALSNGGALLGTAPGCQIVVADPAAAPRHCKIVRSPQGFVVTDMTGGGTVVNGARIKEHVLRDGDVLQIGSERFVFTEKKAAPVPAAAPKAGVAPAPAPAAGGRRPLPARAARGPATGIAAARKLVAKPGSVARVHKDHHLFTLPSTAKGKTIAISVGIGLVLIGGALFAISANTVNSDQVKKKAEEAVKQLEQVPESEHEKRLSMIEDILGNPDFVKYAKAEIHPAARLRESVRKQVELEARADKFAKGFLEEYRRLKEGPAEDFKKEWERLYDTVKVHFEHYERTRQGAELGRVRGELKTLMENVGPNWPDEIVKLSREVSRMISAGQFNTAWLEVENFAKKFNERESNQLRTRLQGERDRIKSAAKDHVDKLKRDAASKSTLQEKKQTLEAGRAFIKGIPDVDKYLEKAISELK